MPCFLVPTQFLKNDAVADDELHTHRALTPASCERPVIDMLDRLASQMPLSTFVSWCRGAASGLAASVRLLPGVCPEEVGAGRSAVPQGRHKADPAGLPGWPRLEPGAGNGRRARRPHPATLGELPLALVLCCLQRNDTIAKHRNTPDQSLFSVAALVCFSRVWGQ